MALALDGAGETLQSSTASSFTIALTTTNSNDLIFVAIQGPSGASTSYSISGSGLTSIAQRGSDLVVGGGRFAVFSAVAASAFSGNITVTINGYGGFGLWGGIAFGVSGANTVSPFDSNGSLPATTVTSTPPTGSTSNANDFVFACLSAASVTQGSGWTLIGNNSANIVAEYQIVSATGSFTGNTSNNTALICGQLDAVVQASAGPTVIPLGFSNNSGVIQQVQAIGW